MRQALTHYCLFALLLLLSSCERSTPVEQAIFDRVLIVGNGSEPSSLDPQVATGSTEANIIMSLFEGLVGADPRDLTPVNEGIAFSWNISNEQTRYTFQLRKSACWNNESRDPITAEDFVYSYHRMLSPDFGASNAYMLYPLRNAEAYNRNQRHKIFFEIQTHPAISAQDIANVRFEEDSSISADRSARGEIESLSKDKQSQLLRHLGLNALEKEEIQLLIQQPELYHWPETLSEEKKQAILTTYLKYAQEDLWELAEVGVTAFDPHTLQLDLRGPTPYLLGLLQHQSWYPVHPPTIQAHGEGTTDYEKMVDRSGNWARLGHMVSNGPFQLSDWKLNNRIEVTRNASYWDQKAVKLNGIRFMAIENQETEQRAFRKGAIHLTQTVPPHRVVWAKQHNPRDLKIDPYLGVYFYRINLNPVPEDAPEETKQARAMLADPRVRKALSLSINRENICQFLKAGQKPGFSFCPPGSGDFGGYESSVRLHESIQEAKDLLKEAGYGKGAEDGKTIPTIELLYNNSEVHKQVAELIQAQWKKHLGIECSLVNQEWKIYQQTIDELNYDIARAAWIGDYNDPNTFLDLWLTGAGNNRTGWSNKAFDDLIAQCAQETDPETRYALFEQAETILLDELPIIPIYFYVSQKMLHPSVKGIHPNLLDRHPYKAIWLNSRYKADATSHP